MDLMKRLEPKYNTLIQAAVIAFLLVVISATFNKEERASSQQQAVSALAY